jgi:hypothetical protein
MDIDGEEDLRRQEHNFSIAQDLLEYEDSINVDQFSVNVPTQ